MKNTKKYLVFSKNDFLSYKTEDKLDTQNDKEILEDFFNYEQGYFCDVMSCIASDNVSIYPQDLFEEVKNLYSTGDTNEALSSESSDLIECIKLAWQFYNERQLRNNFKELIYNWSVQFCMENKLKYTMEKFSYLSENGFEELTEDDDFEKLKELLLHNQN